MLPDRVSNPGPLTYESGALPIALRGPASNELRHDKTSRVACALSDDLDQPGHPPISIRVLRSA